MEFSIIQGDPSAIERDLYLKKASLLQSLSLLLAEELQYSTGGTTQTLQGPKRLFWRLGWTRYITSQGIRKTDLALLLTLPVMGMEPVWLFSLYHYLLQQVPSLLFAGLLVPDSRRDPNYCLQMRKFIFIWNVVSCESSQSSGFSAERFPFPRRAIAPNLITFQ